MSRKDSYSFPQPQNIHVAQVVIDGGIYEPTRDAERLKSRGPDGCLDPDAIAQSYLTLNRQHRSAWASHSGVRLDFPLEARTASLRSALLKSSPRERSLYVVPPASYGLNQ